jgi:hypothetical protein
MAYCVEKLEIQEGLFFSWKSFIVRTKTRLIV